MDKTYPPFWLVWVGYQKGVDAVKWLEWILWFHLVALVVIAELFSLASMTIILLWVLKKKWRWLFHH